MNKPESDEPFEVLQFLVSNYKTFAILSVFFALSFYLQAPLKTLDGQPNADYFQFLPLLSFSIAALTSFVLILKMYQTDYGTYAMKLFKYLFIALNVGLIFFFINLFPAPITAILIVLLTIGPMVSLLYLYDLLGFKKNHALNFLLTLIFIIFILISGEKQKEILKVLTSSFAEEWQKLLVAGFYMGIFMASFRGAAGLTESILAKIKRSKRKIV